MAGRIRHALLAKSKEAALTAVQTYNNPLIKFKSETYIVLMTIAWTYLMHAYYAREGVDCRYLDKDPNSKRKFLRTAEGGYKWWELASCLKVTECPVDQGTVDNLTFLIGLRHEIEHHRPPHLDDHMSGKYLACALNYEYWLTTIFGERYSLGDTVALALHFRDIKPLDTTGVVKLPAGVSRYIEKFEGDMTQEQYDDPRYAYRLRFTRKVANTKGQAADRAIEFLRQGDPGYDDVDPEHWAFKDREKQKYRATAVVRKAREAGYPFFGMYQHTLLWRALDAKNPANGFGVMVANEWFWYETWVIEVLKQCEQLANANITPIAARAVANAAETASS